MKTNRFWLLLLAAVVFVVALLFWRQQVRREPVPAPATHPPTQIIDLSASNRNIAVKNAPLISSLTNASGTNSQISTVKSPSLPEPRALQIQQILQGRNVPISFYGKVVDQNSNSLSNVHIAARIQQPYFDRASYSTDAHQQKVEVVTDANGQFSIQNVKGATLAIEAVEKEGYRLSPKTVNIYAYGDAPQPHHPDPQNPVIFRMWKLGESAKLVSQDKDTRIPYDGTPVAFDLLTGQKNVGGSATGDLRVTLVRNPLNITSGYRNAFEWHATIEAIDGGLIQSDDDFMYDAPEEGYQPKIQIDMPADTNKWASIYDISFLAKTRGGNVYSRVKFEFRVDSPKPETGFTITSAANPTGSRNLQP